MNKIIHQINCNNPNKLKAVGKIGQIVSIIMNGNNDQFRYNRNIFLSKVLFMNNCEKNFVYFNLNKQIFPEVKYIFLNGSNPCDSNVLRRFQNSQIYLSEIYYDSYKKFFEEKNNVHALMKYQFDDVLERMMECKSNEEIDLVCEKIEISLT